MFGLAESLQEIDLFTDGLGVLQKDGTELRQPGSAVAAVKDRLTDLFFQGFHGTGDIRLGEEELLSGPVHATGLRNGNDLS